MRMEQSPEGHEEHCAEEAALRGTSMRTGQSPEEHEEHCAEDAALRGTSMRTGQSPEEHEEHCAEEAALRGTSMRTGQSPEGHAPYQCMWPLSIKAPSLCWKMASPTSPSKDCSILIRAWRLMIQKPSRCIGRLECVTCIEILCHSRITVCVHWLMHAWTTMALKS